MDEGRALGIPECLLCLFLPQQLSLTNAGAAAGPHTSACKRCITECTLRTPSASRLLHPLVQAVTSAASVPKIKAADLLVAGHPHIAHVGALRVGKSAIVAAPGPVCFLEG